MDNKLDNQLLIVPDTIEANRQYSDEKMKNLAEYLTVMIKSIMDHIKTSKYSPDKKDLPKS